MEQHQVPEASQNCFLPTGAVQRAIRSEGKEIFSYDEAEPLMYGCSVTSMPPRSAGNIRALRSEEISATGGSRRESKTYHRKSRKSTTTICKSPEGGTDGQIRFSRSADGGTLRNNVASELKSQILSKFKEFAITPNTSCSNFDEISKNVTVGSINANKSRSCGSKSENKSQDIEEVFIHTAKFLSSSSDSERVRIASEDVEDDVFSTGISDMEEVVKKTVDIKSKSEDAHASREELDTTDSQRNWFARKNIMNKWRDAKMEGPVILESPIRIGPLVQDRMSLRSQKNSPPCPRLLDEIRKNNLVMKEEIFSSSSPKISDFPNSHFEKAGGSSRGNSKGRDCNRQKSRNMEMGKSSNIQRSFIGATVGKTNIMQPHATTENEVYEAIGSVKNSAEFKAQQKQGTRQDTNRRTPDINALAANIRFLTNQFHELWRPFNPPDQIDLSNWSNEQTKTKPNIPPMTLSPEAILALQATQQGKQPVVSQNNSNTLQHVLKNDLNSERHFHQINDYLEAKISTPNRRQEKYVKLPGLSEALVQRDSNFKDIRIKDGTSFESLNALEVVSMRKIANQILDSKSANIPGMEMLAIGQRKPETKDAATDFRTPLKNTKTQTGDLKNATVDSFVQCESYIVDEANDRNVIKNDHQEIMVCNDNGDGVQLYNELGHPLTDMDGYLLKDSLGRFLVRLDQYGVPISCTNGQAIFMDDSKPWNKVKHTLSIIHQARKKIIKREATAKKGKARPSLRQLESAMNNLRSTLEWAEKTSLGSSQENSRKRLTDFGEGEHRPLINIKPTLDAANLNNNTNSLIGEMKSIAQLRNTLLEKVNFIVDNQNKLGKSGKSAKSGAKKGSKHLQEPYTENWLKVSNKIREHPDRPCSPTYQAVEKRRDGETKYEADLRINSLSAGSPTQHRPILNITDKVQNNIGVDLWKNLASRDSLSNDFQIKNTLEGNRPKTERDLWIDDKPCNHTNAHSSEVKRPGAKENGTDLRNFIHEKSIDKSLTNSNDKFHIPKINRYSKLYEDLEISDVRLVSKDTDNLTGVSSLKDPGDSAVTGSKLLISLENEYCLADNGRMDPWKIEKFPWNRTPHRKMEATSGM